jgi:hypothetical protein
MNLYSNHPHRRLALQPQEKRDKRLFGCNLGFKMAFGPRAECPLKAG